MTSDWDVMAPEFTVLVVCTANICRSPIAERMLQKRFDEIAAGEFRVSSAGTHGLTGQGAEPTIVGIAAHHGLSLDDFTARALVPKLVEEADLILTMERTHRSHIALMVPAALKRTFTLREFARILPHVPAESAARPSQRWHSLVALAQRHRRPPGEPRFDDVVDPYGCSPRIYEEMLAQLLPAVEALFDWELHRSPKRS